LVGKTVCTFYIFIDSVTQGSNNEEKKLSKAYLKYYVLCTTRLNANFMTKKLKENFDERDNRNKTELPLWNTRITMIGRKFPREKTEKFSKKLKNFPFTTFHFDFSSSINETKLL